MVMMIDEKKLQESVDRSEIVNLISKSIITRDSGLWDQLAECYHSEAEFTSSWYKGKPADFFKVASRKLDAARKEGGEQKHVTSNHWIEIKGDRAIAESDLILFMRRAIKGVELDFATWSRRLQLMAREKGEWKIYRRWVIYERDRMDPVDPTVPVDSYYDAAALSKYPAKLRYHLWRNEMMGSAPEKHICIRGTEQDAAARAESRKWIEGG
jgi:hypothetical protein